MSIKNIIKLLLIQLKLDCIRLKAVSFSFFLVIFICFMFIFVWRKSTAIKPDIIICNEERGMFASLVINSILNDRITEIVNFVQEDYEIGREEVDRGRALLLLHIKKDTINTLYQGKKAEIDIYAKNENNDFARLIISYVRGFTDIINVSQNAGLYYMEVLSENGKNDEERFTKFSELQRDYMKLILLRNSIFVGSDDIMGISKEEVKFGYNLLIAIILVGLSIEKMFHSILFCKMLKQRLLMSGILNVELYITFIIELIFMNLFIWIILINIGRFIGIGG